MTVVPRQLKPRQQMSAQQRQWRAGQTRAALRLRIAAIERGGGVHKDTGSAGSTTQTALPFGVTEIDSHLPWGGLALAGVHEITEAGMGNVPANIGVGASATGFVAVLLGALQRIGGARPVLWVAPRRKDHETLYGPGLAAFGFDVFDPHAGLILVRARGLDQVLWAMEEGLREPQVAAVVAELPPGRNAGLTASRRLQLAAEAGGTFGVLLRAEANKRTPPAPSACLTRWRVAPLATGAGSAGGLTLFCETPRWRVDLLRCRGAAPGGWNLQWSANEEGMSDGGMPRAKTDWRSHEGGNKAARERPQDDAKEPKSKYQKRGTTTCNFSLVSKIQNRLLHAATDVPEPPDIQPRRRSAR